MQDQPAVIDWRDGRVPVSRRFDDPYFSLEDGLAETAHVFLAGNDLPARFRDGFQIAELGFGTGLNLLVSWAAWEASGQSGRFGFTTFEAYPMALSDMAKALAAFPSLDPFAKPLLSALANGGDRHDLGGPILTLVRGDARETLPLWEGKADAWYLDGFAPARNPEMWGDDLMQAVAAHTTPGGTAASYTAAGHVRRSLTDGGFDVTRVPGYGRKRHMTLARMPE